jgi:transcription elongation factor S-II
LIRTQLDEPLGFSTSVPLKIWKIAKETIHTKVYHCPKSLKKTCKIYTKMENTTRQFVIDRISSLLEIPKDDTICINLEKNILNHTSDRARAIDEEPAWDNHKFSGIYKQKFLQIQHNLKNSPVLKGWIIDKKIKTKDVVDMRPEDLWPDGPYAKKMEERIVKEIRKAYLASEVKNQEGFFTCGRCKSKKTTYYQLQTRSADEPMTTFVTCLNCDRNWKC